MTEYTGKWLIEEYRKSAQWSEWIGWYDSSPKSLEFCIGYLKNLAASRTFGQEMRDQNYSPIRIRNIDTEEVIPLEALGIL